MAGLTAFLGLGSNLRRESSLLLGLDYLQRMFGPLVVSSLYESSAVGYQGPPYYNLALSFTCELDAFTLARRLRQIEFTLGRPVHSAKFTPRALDIDFLMLGHTVISSKELTLPRTDILSQEFVLAPLAEIAPDIPHPVRQRCFAELLRDWPYPSICQCYPLTKLSSPLA